MRNFFRCEWMRKHGKIPFVLANATLYSILMAVAKALADLTVYHKTTAIVVIVYAAISFFAGLCIGLINWNRIKESTDMKVGN